MSSTVIQTFGQDPKAQKKWSAFLHTETMHKGYFTRKFEGTGENVVIQRKTDLESEAGDVISFDLSVQLRGRPKVGDNRVEGSEEALRFFSDEVRIDQIRHGVDCGGRMTRKRTALDLRRIGRDRLSDYWAAYLDELKFIYLSGARGSNEDFIEGLDYAGHASNPIQAPDNAHVVYGGSATSFNTITTGDPMTRAVVERAATKARSLRTLNPQNANMQGVNIDGEVHYVMVMSEFQAYHLRTSDTAGWLDIQKAAAAAEGRKNPIFKGGLGMINNAVLHSHESVVRFDNAGAGANVPAARALFLGRQAAAIAYGTAGGHHFTWVEELKDAGALPMVYAGMILGIKKTRFNNKDYGVLAVDTYAVNPNPA